jgi:hypothetical protein
MKATGIGHYYFHMSKYASDEELQRFIDSFAILRVIPVHFEDREGLSKLSSNVDC